jgi:hypothetical protein
MYMYYQTDIGSIFVTSYMESFRPQSMDFFCSDLHFGKFPVLRIFA